MDPLSRKKRKIYFVIFFVMFIVFVPFLIFDAKGYKFNWTDVLRISSNGGLYIETNQSGIDIYINDKLVKTTSIIQKNVFVQDLKPGIYKIKVSKEGLQTWTKNLEVFPEIVTDTNTFLIKAKPVLTEIPQYLNDKIQSTISTSTTNKLPTKNPEYTSIASIFSAVPPKPILGVATSSANNKNLRNILVDNQGGVLHVSWKGDEDAIPSYFCENDKCKNEITINTGSKILSFDFLPGRDDLLVIRLDSGIFVTEIDDRSVQNIQTLVSGSGYDFRVKSSEAIYIKKDNKIFSVSY